MRMIQSLGYMNELLEVFFANFLELPEFFFH